MDGKRRLGSALFDVRPGEAGLVGRVALLFGLAEGARALGEIGVDTLVSLRLGPQHYPVLFVVLGLVSLVVSLAYGAALGRLPRRPLLVGLFLVISVVLLAGWVALHRVGNDVLPALWVATFSASALIITMTWTVAGGVLDLRQARRLFPAVTGAAIAGSLVGNLLAGPLAGLLGTSNLIAVEALLLVAASVVLARTPLRATVPTFLRGRAPSITTELRAGFDFVARSPLMRLVALSYVLFSILNFSVTYPYFTAMSAAFPQETRFATVNGLIQTGVTATSFVLTMMVAARLYSRFGVTIGGVLLPLVYLLGFGLWIVSFGVATAVLVRWVQQSTQRGLSNAAWSALYNVVPGQRRAQVLAFNDGVPGQLGIIVSGLLLIAVQRFLGLEQVFWLGAVTAALCTLLVVLIRRRYAASLLAALRSGLAEQVLDGHGALDPGRSPEVLRALQTTLQDPEPAVRAMAASMLGRVATPTALHSLDAASRDPDPAVRAAAVAGLVSGGPRSATWSAVEQRLVDPSPAVRGVAAVGLAQHGDPRGPAAISALLAGSTSQEWIAGLRAAAAVPAVVDIDTISTLARNSDAEVRAAAVRVPGAPTADLLAALADPAPSVSGAAAQALSGDRTAHAELLRILRTGTQRTQEMALTALGGARRDEITGWAHEQIERATALRAARSGLGNGDEMWDFLASTLVQRAMRLEDLAVLAAATLGSSAVDGGVLRRSLRAPDPDVRAQAVEALDSVVDRPLGRALAALLEPVASGPGESADEILDRLSRDSDEWIRALAVACGGHRNPVDGEAVPMPTASLAELQAMLALRRVPIFSNLDPEDLHALAKVAQECWYPAGAVLIEAGALGDELVVIIEGSVRVVQPTDHGGERFIRSYGAGQHIGELAVLAGRPRAATVIAEATGVRGLVIGGAGIKALLRERPEAAMAMLATLAERIGTQP